MPFRLYKMTLDGKIAVANMLLIIAVFLVFPLTSYGSGGLPDPVGVLAILVLTFPVGWLSAFFLNHFRDQPLLAVVLVAVFVVLNAYLWGYSWRSWSGQCVPDCPEQEACRPGRRPGFS